MWYMLTGASEELTASVTGPTSTLTMEAVNTSENAGKYLPDYTVKHPRRQPSSYSWT
jgi:hypothetical protein